MRDDITITFATPLDGAFTKPASSAALSSLLAEKNIELVTEFNTGEVDGAAKKLIGYDDREIPYDLAVVIPLHGGAAYVRDSPGLGDELGLIPTGNATLQSRVSPRIFVLGDAADLPASKAGSVTHFEGEVLVEIITAFLEGRELTSAFKGTGPTVRRLGKTSGVTVKELCELFPKGPAKLAARCAGVPKPHGCI